MKSIIKSARCCFFCGAETNLELHHVMHGTADRRRLKRYKAESEDKE